MIATVIKTLLDFLVFLFCFWFSCFSVYSYYSPQHLYCTRKCNRMLSFFQFFLNHLICHCRICLSFAGLHNLANQESYSTILTIFEVSIDCGLLSKTVVIIANNSDVSLICFMPFSFYNLFRIFSFHDFFKYDFCLFTTDFSIVYHIDHGT